MQLRFPNIANTECRLFRACGQLSRKNKKGVKRTSGGHRPYTEWLHCPFRMAGKRMIVLAAFEQSKGGTGQHVHVDIATPDLFSGDLPGKRVELQAIKSKVEAMEGRGLYADFEGHFFLDDERLPRLVRSTKFEFGIEGVTLS